MEATVIMKRLHQDIRPRTTPRLHLIPRDPPRLDLPLRRPSGAGVILLWMGLGFIVAGSVLVVLWALGVPMPTVGVRAAGR